MAKKTTEKVTKEVYNRGGHRVELIVDGNVQVLLPGSTLIVPIETTIPEGIGLFVR